MLWPWRPNKGQTGRRLLGLWRLAATAAVVNGAAIDAGLAVAPVDFPASRKGMSGFGRCAEPGLHR